MAKKFFDITLATRNRVGLYLEITGDTDVEVIKWYIKPGDRIAGIVDPDTGIMQGGNILEIDAAKGTKDVIATKEEIGGILTEILVPEGGRVRLDFRHEPLRLGVIEMDVATDQYAHVKEIISESRREIELAQPTTPLARELAEDLGVRLPTSDTIVRVDDIVCAVPDGFLASDILAAPATRVLAKDIGVALQKVRGSGPQGLIMSRDVAAIKETIVSPRVDDERTAETIKTDDEVEVIKIPLSHIAMAENLQRAWLAPLASTGIDINPVPLLELRTKMRERFKHFHGVTLRLDYFVTAACAWLLGQEKVKILNARWVDDREHSRIELYKRVNIGIAVGILPPVSRGRFSSLLTPVVKRANEKSFAQIAKEADRIIRDAVDGHPAVEDQVGVTFVINNTGNPVKWEWGDAAGDEYPDPIIAPDTAGLLAFASPRDVGGEKRMRLRLCFDHRIVNGYEAKLFIRMLHALLEEPEQILTLI